MASADDASLTFCVEDTCALRDEPSMIGVVDRTALDVDSHTHNPQRDYPDELQRHDEIPEADFQAFLRTGVPPRGTVLVSWQTELKTELIPEHKLELLDRAFYVGDVVKKNARDTMSGTVVALESTCTLCPVLELTDNLERIEPDELRKLYVRDVPTSELKAANEIMEGALVIYENWVGRVEYVYDEITLQLENDSVVVVEDANDLEPINPANENLSVGDMVTTKKGNLRRGRWKFGAFNPNIPPKGTVVETRPTSITVHWLYRNIGAGSVPNMPGAFPVSEPPEELDVDIIYSGNLYVYERQTPPYLVGDRVRFKDSVEAAHKYPKFKRIPREETLGYDMNVFCVMQTRSIATVQWQDLSVSEHPSTSLIPDPNIDDEDEVWPGEIVFTKKQREGSQDASKEDGSWTFTPAQVGVVQTVRSADRIATVKWFQNPSVQLVGHDLLPGSYTGSLMDEAEDVSLYDIRASVGLDRHMGDFVIIHQNVEREGDGRSLLDNQAGISGINWFGEVTRVGLDGLVEVTLGAALPPTSIRVPPESLTLVYNHGMEDDYDAVGHDHDHYTDTSMDDDSDMSDSSSNVMWTIEYMGNGGIPFDGSGLDEEEWSTEDEGMDDAEEGPGSDLEADGPPADTPFDDNNNMDADGAGIGQGPTDSQNPSEIRPTSAESGTPEALSPFAVLETSPPSDHHYIACKRNDSPNLLRRLAKEHRILSSSLPEGIYVRTWESRMDLLRVLILGPLDTPYEYAPFMIDLYLGESFPASPPEAFFHSWTHGQGPVNPNLYEDGKICLSLLGTWHSDASHEDWSERRSTVLQVLVSLQSLVLVREPYYNEAGFDVRQNAPEAAIPSALYTERAHFRARGFIVWALTRRPEPFGPLLEHLYLSEAEGAPRLLEKAIRNAREIVERSEREDGAGAEGGGEGGLIRDGLRRVSLGAVVALKRVLGQMEELMEKRGEGKQ